MGYHGDETTKTCLKCDPSCKSCNSSQKISVHLAKLHIFYSNQQENCSNCHQTCLTYFGPNSNQCSYCQLPHYFDKITNQGTAWCSNGFFPVTSNNQPICLTYESAYGEGCVFCDQKSCNKCGYTFFLLVAKFAINLLFFEVISAKASDKKVIMLLFLQQCHIIQQQNEKNVIASAKNVKIDQMTAHFALRFCDSLGLSDSQVDCQNSISSSQDKYQIEIILGFMSAFLTKILFFSGYKFEGFLSAYCIQVIQMIGNYCLTDINSLYIAKEFALKYALTHNYFNVIPTQYIFPKSESVKTFFSSQYYPMLINIQSLMDLLVLNFLNQSSKIILIESQQKQIWRETKTCSLRCDNPYVQQENICQNICNDGYYASPPKIIQNNLIAKCEKCDSKCQKCDQSADDCTLCSDLLSTDCMSEINKSQYMKLKLCDSLGFVKSQKYCNDLNSQFDKKYIVENVVGFISLIFMAILVLTDLKFVDFLNVIFDGLVTSKLLLSGFDNKLIVLILFVLSTFFLQEQNEANLRHNLFVKIWMICSNMLFIGTFSMEEPEHNIFRDILYHNYIYTPDCQQIKHFISRLGTLRPYEQITQEIQLSQQKALQILKYQNQNLEKFSRLGTQRPQILN
ncbi:hypothetical protein ABPG72_009631 [Tetrahymena utriculariae]